MRTVACAEPEEAFQRIDGPKGAQAAGRWQSVAPAARPAFLPLAGVAPLLARIERNPDPLAPLVATQGKGISYLRVQR